MNVSVPFGAQRAHRYVYGRPGCVHGRFGVRPLLWSIDVEQAAENIGGDEDIHALREWAWPQKRCGRL